LIDDAQILHVLATNVNDCGHPGKQMIGGSVMGHSFDFAVFGL